VKQAELALRELISAMQRGEFLYREGRIYRTLWRGMPCEPQTADGLTSYGYRRVQYVGPLFTRPVTVLAHRLIWVYHNGAVPAGYEINHIDGVKHNNLLSNLELVTRSENMRHRHASGNVVYALTLDQVREIRALYATGIYTRSQVARRIGVSYSQVNHVVRGDNWGWLDE
jgi:hypothetical protein